MRTLNSIRNTGFALAGQLIGILLNFINRTIFIHVLGVEYLGINGLFGNIIMMLSLAELGVGSAIIFSMYKPLAEKDVTKIKALMRLYSKAYRSIGIAVFLFGVSLVPFLDVVIKDTPNIHNLKFIYLLYVTNAAASYFFSYKRSIIIADQKEYINTKNHYMFISILNVAQIIVLIFTSNFILYLIIRVLFTLLSNIYISKKANKLYPFITDKRKEYLNKSEKNTIFKYVLAMMSHKVGGVVVNGTDNLLISALIGIYWVGIYSNYYMIVSMLSTLIGQLFKAVAASIGNLYVTESVQKTKEVFNNLLFVNFWIYGFCSICLWVLLSPFITLWIGEKFLLTSITTSIIVFNFFINGMRQTTTTFNSAIGLFWNDRFKPWFEATINLISSIILINFLGITGVFLGTLISTLTTSFWVEPYILYKHGFKSSINDYFVRYFSYIFAFIVAGFITWFICIQFEYTTWNVFFVKMIVCIFVPNLIFLLFFHKNKEFQYFVSLISKIQSKL